VPKTLSNHLYYRPIAVEKPIPYTFDLGNLLAQDLNPLPPSSSIDEDVLSAAARDGSQALINQLLTTCPVSSTPDGVLLTLPAPAIHLPREKPLPKPKPPTKWERFAKKKGIGNFNPNSSKEERRKKLVYDEEKGEWVPKWGYKGKNKDGEGDWLVEVDEKKQKAESGPGGRNARGAGKDERMERVRRNERNTRKGTAKK